MKYSRTGRFTADQEKLAKEIADRLKKIKEKWMYHFCEI